MSFSMYQPFRKNRFYATVKNKIWIRPKTEKKNLEQSTAGSATLEQSTAGSATREQSTAVTAMLYSVVFQIYELFNSGANSGLGRFKVFTLRICNTVLVNYVCKF